MKLQLNARRVLSIHFAGFDDRIRAHARLNTRNKNLTDQINILTHLNDHNLHVARLRPPQPIIRTWVAAGSFGEVRPRLDGEISKDLD